jgi:tight adherence protein B
MFCAAVIVPVGMFEVKKELLKKRNQVLLVQFKDSLRFVSGALSVGYSIENAWKEAEKDMIKLYGSEADMCKELSQMNTAMELREPIEKLLLDFAIRSGQEDVNDFCQIFSFAKRSGGDFIRIMQHTENRISDKVEILQDMETFLAAKKLEQRVMNTVPLLLLLFVQSSSPEFIRPLYGNALGVIVMSICLLLYGGAIIIAQKIVDIEV